MGEEKELKSTWERLWESILRSKRSLHSLHSRTLSHALQSCTHTHTDTTACLHCSPLAPTAVLASLRSGKEKPTAHTEPHGAVVAAVWAGQRAHACTPHTPRHTFQLQEAAVIKRHPCLLLIATRKASEPALDSELCEGEGVAASPPNTASSRQVPWKHPPRLPLSHVWSTPSLLRAFHNLFTLAEVGLLQAIIADLSTFYNCTFT